MGYQYKFDIAGTEYGMSDVASVKLEHPLFDKLSVGNTCSAELDITFWSKGDIPKMAKIVPYILLNDSWHQLCEVWTDTRAKVGDKLNIIAYDAMMKGDLVWVPDDALEFPMPMPQAVQVICDLMGVELDSRTVLNSGYTIDYPANDWTLRDVLGFIGAAHGGNWIVTHEGKLLLIPLFVMNTTHEVGKQVSSFELYDELGPITGIALLLDDENELIAGDDTGYMLEVSCPYGTQAMAEDLLAKLQGKTYQGFRAENAVLSPAAELGDGVNVNGISSFLAHRTATFGPGHMSEIAAPGESTMEHEFSWKSPEKKDFERKIAETRSLISKTTEELLLMVEGFDGRISELSVDVDSIEGRVEGVEGEFASFLLDTDGFFVFDASGNRSAIRGSSIDTTTLNVQNINFTGVIRWTDFNEDTQSYIDEIYDLAAEAYDLANSGHLPPYITETYIDRVLIKSPTIKANDIGLYGGYFEIYDSTGKEFYGSMGYGSGMTTAGDVTRGVVLSAGGNTDLGEEGNYMIATNGGVRMQSGGSKVFAVDGMAVMESHGNQIYVGASGAYIKVGGVISPIGSGGGGTGATDPNGYMIASAYDPAGVVAAAGGIAAYVIAYIDEALKGSY